VDSIAFQVVIVTSTRFLPGKRAARESKIMETTFGRAGGTVRRPYHNEFLPYSKNREESE
jgi:hypothetical protein